MVASPTGQADFYVCVDVETSGPIPGDYSLLSIGACTISKPPDTFYIELQPINANFTPESARVHQLSIERLQAEGTEPAEAMERFERWLDERTPPGSQPVFVAFNASFDWMFINYYFIHYLQRNPFGHAALDIKALYMGQVGVAWSRTAWRYLSLTQSTHAPLSHHALQDALDQAVLFRQLITSLQDKSNPPGDKPA